MSPKHTEETALTAFAGIWESWEEFGVIYAKGISKPGVLKSLRTFKKNNIMKKHSVFSLCLI